MKNNYNNVGVAFYRRKKGGRKFVIYNFNALSKKKRESGYDIHLYAKLIVLEYIFYSIHAYG